MADSKGSRFEGKVSIVTGGCKGIGKGIVDVFVENGGKVAIFDIDDKLGETLNSGDILYVNCNVTIEESILTAVKTVVDKFGQIDCLVNNAGISVRTSLETSTMEDFRKLLDINLVAYFGTIKYAIPHLRKTKGSVVNISSINGIMANQSTGFYNASKGGVTALTKSIAIDEVKNGVRVNSISPGVIDTPMFQAVIQQQPPEFLHRWESISQMRRMGSPREIGLACLFLATDATFCTGVDLLCTGGAELGFGNKLSQH